MNFETLMIRKAELQDLHDIWHLLHANCIGWNDQDIRLNLERLVILQQQQKILGVLCRKLTLNEPEVEWVAIHPIYPEKPLQEVLVQSFISTRYNASRNRSFSMKDSLSPI